MLTTLAIMIATALSTASPATGTVPAGKETVVLVHGMGRTTFSMKPMARHLEREGFRVLQFGYPSTRQSIGQSVADLQAMISAERLGEHAPVHFVAHSLGGIVVRACLSEQRPPMLGRVVMLGVPNQGSEVADRLRNKLIYRWATGPAGQSLGTSSDCLPNRLGPVDYPVGVVAGTRSWNPLFSAWLRGPSDGKVSVARCRLTGMADFIEVPSSHTWLMNSRRVQRQAARFLRNGSFEQSRS